MNKEDVSLRRKFADLLPLLDERSRRLMAASEARSLGYGGISRIQRACGLSRKAIAKGMREIAEGSSIPGRIRRSGAGRKSLYCAGSRANSQSSLGNYDNGGKQWLPAKKPVKVNGHDFPSPDVPRAYPYGIYDLARNTGFVNVGMDHDTGAFAVASIRGWW